jgi:hypothetical protein
MPARICAIIQLCLAFIIILWNISQPFMRDLFTYKSQMLIYQDVMGINNSASSTDAIARQERNRKRFDALPDAEKAQLIHRYDDLHQIFQRTFSDKLERALRILVFKISFYEQIWLILSIILPILLLKRVEGVSLAIWLLPMLTCIYTVDNYVYGRQAAISAEFKLFPSESVLVNEYLQQPLSSNILQQKEQLRTAWESYLIQNWSSKNSDMDMEQLTEEGEFKFNVERVKKLTLPRKIILGRSGLYKEHVLILALYLFWNFFFAFIVFQTKQKVLTLNQII